LHELALERIDLVEPRARLAARDLAVDGRDEQVLIVRAVEYPDEALCRDFPVNAPQEVVQPLLRRRNLERRDVAPLRIDATHDVPDRAVLAARVDRLQDDEERLLALRVQPLLERIECRNVRLGLVERP